MGLRSSSGALGEDCGDGWILIGWIVCLGRNFPWPGEDIRRFCNASLRECTISLIMLLLANLLAWSKVWLGINSDYGILEGVIASSLQKLDDRR